MANYPTYSVDFDRNQAKEALRGDGEEDDYDYATNFAYDKWAEVPMNEYEPETCSKHVLMTHTVRPLEIWELIFRLAKRQGAMSDPELADG